MIDSASMLGTRFERVAKRVHHLRGLEYDHAIADEVIETLRVMQIVIARARRHDSTLRESDLIRAMQYALREDVFDRVAYRAKFPIPCVRCRVGAPCNCIPF